MMKRVLTLLVVGSLALPGCGLGGINPPCEAAKGCESAVSIGDAPDMPECVAQRCDRYMCEACFAQCVMDAMDLADRVKDPYDLTCTDPWHCENDPAASMVLASYKLTEKELSQRAGRVIRAIIQPPPSNAGRKLLIRHGGFTETEYTRYRAISEWALREHFVTDTMAREVAHGATTGNRLHRKLWASTVSRAVLTAGQRKSIPTVSAAGH